MTEDSIFFVVCLENKKKEKKMKVAVTSANGALGSTILSELVTAIGSENVIGLARSPEKAKHLGVEVRKGDYSSREQFENGLRGIDVVIILSGNASPKDRIPQHRNIIEAAKSNGLKKIVYTSIVGPDNPITMFSDVIRSNRQTELDIQSSGMDWSIGRNSIYIEPDLEYIDTYKKDGGIFNCAGGEKGLCSYTSRAELAAAYVNMILNDEHNGKVYNLGGEAISQKELAEKINDVFGTDLVFKPVSVEEYENERSAALGDHLGPIIAGIYHGISLGDFNPGSDFEKAAGRKHKTPIEMMEGFKNSTR